MSNSPVQISTCHRRPALRLQATPVPVPLRDPRPRDLSMGDVCAPLWVACLYRPGSRVGAPCIRVSKLSLVPPASMVLPVQLNVTTVAKQETTSTTTSRGIVGSRPTIPTLSSRPILPSSGLSSHKPCSFRQCTNSWASFVNLGHRIAFHSTSTTSNISAGLARILPRRR